MCGALGGFFEGEEGFMEGTEGVGLGDADFEELRHTVEDSIDVARGLVWVGWRKGCDGTGFSPVKCLAVVVFLSRAGQPEQR